MKRISIFVLTLMLTFPTWATADEERCVVPSCVVCPRGAFVEAEWCRGAPTGWNNGCTVRELRTVTCDTVICGASIVTENYHDTDWFRVDLRARTDNVLLKWKAVAEFDVTVRIIGQGPGADSCLASVTIDEATAARCSTAIASACVAPGVYWLEVTPASSVTSLACTTYVAQVTCSPCGEPTYTDVDMGDLPRCNYPTLTNNPGHGLSGIAWLGDVVTGEAAPHAEPLDPDPADDGVNFLNAPWWEPCDWESLTVTVTGGDSLPAYAATGGLLYLNAWKDGNLDGDFCDVLCGEDRAPEWFLQNVIVVPGVYGFRVHDPGVDTIRRYDGVFRFRLTSRRMADAFGFGLIDTSACPNMICGTFGLDFLGEVEDYVMEDFQLAVEMGTFDAIPGDNRITLRWNTLSESNNDHFDVERDGAVLARPRGLGDSPSGHSYRWVDEQVQSAVTYTYKLYSVDLNGTRRALATVSAAPNSSPAAVTEYALNQNYPNPFNPTTQITFDIVESGPVTLTIFNPVGQLVTTLVNGPMTAGRHTIAFDAGNLPTGVYLYRLEAGSFTAAHKMLLIK